VIDKLEFLISLAREKHFGRAAEACGVTQPTLSAGIKQLEETLGVLLVRRGARFESLTPEGERILEWAWRIAGDARAMRQEMKALTQGLAGHVRIAAIPMALAVVAALTTPYRARHPDVSFTVLSRTSAEILELLDNLKIDAGVTYVDNEPIGLVQTVPLYREQYRLVTSENGPLGNREQVTWADVGRIPLCLLTPDTQSRRIIDRYLRDAGCEPTPSLVSDSMTVLLTHIRTGQWASVMPAQLAEVLGLVNTVRSIPIVARDPYPTIGLVVARREPMLPLTAALIAEARRVAPTLSAVRG
jgi:DNA-binding transcriptional LysR family regulator